jgi:tellurite resistance protein
MSEQIQQQAQQLGVGEDIAQQLGQTASQFGTDTNINTEQQIQQQAQQLGVGEDIAQQLGQTASQIGFGKDTTQKNIGQQTEQRYEAFSSDVEQKISQTATQIAKSSEDQGSEESSDVQQVIKQIATQSSKDDDDVNQIINQISTQIDNNPKSDLAKSLGNLAGLYGSGNKDQVDQAIQQIGTQIAIGDNIDQNIIQNIVQKSYQATNNYFKNKIKYDIDYDKRYYDHDDDDDDIKVIKKVYKRDNSCPTQSDSLQLKGKILGKGVIVVADFEPCDLRDGRATLNIPTNHNLQFVVLSLDKKGNEHNGVIVSKQKIQSLAKDSGLYVVNFDDRMTGKDPVTGKKKTIDDINGLAIYNTATKSLNFKSGNSLALTAVLKK